MARTKYIAPVVKEPAGSTVNALVESYSSDLITALSWYSTHKNSNDARSYLMAYAKKQGASKANLLAIDALTTSDIPNSNGWLARLLTNGAVLDQKDVDRLSKTLKDIFSGVYTKAAEPKAKKASAPRLTVQEAMAAKANDLLGEFEGMLDDFITGNGSKEERAVYRYLQKNEVPKAYTKNITEWVDMKLREFGGVLKSKDEQILEGYSNFSKKALALLIKWLASVKEDALYYENYMKANRPARKRKEKPAAVQAAKVKYAAEDKELGIRSKNPAELVGAQQAWVYNTKSRMLAVYNAAGPKGLGIKGTTLNGFDIETSKQKRLRKPKDVIQSVLDSGKVALRKLLDSVRATEYNPNGRINKDMIIVRVA
jgi:hypothetical protein